jgi:hypothetical protein
MIEWIVRLNDNGQRGMLGSNNNVDNRFFIKRLHYRREYVTNKYF